MSTEGRLKGLSTEGRRKGSDRGRANADEFAAKVLPIIRELQASGVRGPADRAGTRAARDQNAQGRGVVGHVCAQHPQADRGNAMTSPWAVNEAQLLPELLVLGGELTEPAAAELRRVFQTLRRRRRRNLVIVSSVVVLGVGVALGAGWCRASA
jgi:hypothetical protein